MFPVPTSARLEGVKPALVWTKPVEGSVPIPTRDRTIRTRAVRGPSGTRVGGAWSDSPAVVPTSLPSSLPASAG